VKTKAETYPLIFHYGIVEKNLEGIFVIHNHPDKINSKGGNTVREPLEKWIKGKEIISVEKSRKLLIKKLIRTKITKKLYDTLYFSKPKNLFNKAYRYYLLNRCSFSGITRWNSYIGDVRFNIHKLQNLINELGIKLKNTKITNYDFEKVLLEKPAGKKIFFFLDPPYAESRQIVAYNVTFEKKDHERLAKILRKTKHPFLLTYDDCKYVRNLYKWANFYDRTWRYSVANSRVHHNPRESGNELFISNFKLLKKKKI
jgi:DNA adenine methylase